MIIKFSYFHLHPLEFLYFLLAFGALFLLFLPNLILKLRDNFFIIQTFICFKN